MEKYVPGGLEGRTSSTKVERKKTNSYRVPACCRLIAFHTRSSRPPQFSLLQNRRGLAPINANISNNPENLI
jgi:hypothetical protein